MYSHMYSQSLARHITIFLMRYTCTHDHTGIHVPFSCPSPMRLIKISHGIPYKMYNMAIVLLSGWVKSSLRTKCTHIYVHTYTYMHMHIYTIPLHRPSLAKSERAENKPGGRRSPAVAYWASDHWVASSNPLRGMFHH